MHKKSFNVFITFLIFLIGFSLTGRSQDSASAVDIIRKIIQESGIQAAKCRFVEMKSDSKQKSLFVEDEFTSLGYQLINKGMIPEAVAVLEMAVSAFPKSWNVLIQLGDAYALDGNKKEALEAYKKSLKLNPENENLEWKLQKIDSAVYDGLEETRLSSQYEPGQQTGLKGPYLGQDPPGIEPKVFAPGIVSTRGGFEFSCTFSPDCKEFYFTRGTDIWVCYWEEKGWTAPQKAWFNSDFLDHEPHISPDGTRMFFGSGRPRPDIKEGENSYGIYIMERTTDGWGKPKYFGPGMYITTARNGNYYITDIFEIAGGGIAMARFKDGRYTKLKKVSDEINNSSDLVGHPCIAPDESFLLFDSDGFCVSFRNEAGNWGKPIHLNALDTPGGGMCSSLSPDSKYIFYHVKRDIYWVSSKILETVRNSQQPFSTGRGITLEFLIARRL